MVFELAEGLGSRFWTGDVRASYAARLAGLGLTVGDLPESGEPLRVKAEEPAERAWRRSGFGPPTGRVEFVSTTLEGLGHPRLPVYRNPLWSPSSNPEVGRTSPSSSPREPGAWPIPIPRGASFPPCGVGTPNRASR